MLQWWRMMLGSTSSPCALVQKASDIAKTECQRAMDLAQRISSQLRAAEERAREFEAEAKYLRDRAACAEEWLVNSDRCSILRKMG
jgi:hypothetical protein